jgi:hypothetical protein
MRIKLKSWLASIWVSKKAFSKKISKVNLKYYRAFLLGNILHSPASQSDILPKLENFCLMGNFSVI